MEEEEVKKGRGGGKLNRSEVTTVRLDPKLRYMAELAARKQRRTLSSFIEWAIEHALDNYAIEQGDQWSNSFMSQAPKLWDVIEADRFAKLALHYPDLLTHEEQVIWKIVKECGVLWRGKYAPTWTWRVNEESLLFDRLRKHWETLKAVAHGDLPATMLPTWPLKDPKAQASNLDEDLPF